MRPGPGSAQNASRTERLLLEREEHGVYELEVLEVIVDHVVEFQPLLLRSVRVQTRKSERVTHFRPHADVTEAPEDTMLVNLR